MTVEIPSRAEILQAVRQHQVTEHAVLTQHFSLTSPMEQEALRRRLQAMLRDGQLMLSRNGHYHCFHYTAEMAIAEVELQYGLPTVWPDSVFSEIRALPESLEPSDYKGREDLRRLPFVTIDGVDAKDFDDAVYCQAAQDGWTLYVAIADVSHYVRLGSEIDEEALARGTSTYFPGYVIPMLPERLSNDLCSLVPAQDRLAMVAELSVSTTGELVASRFYPAVIHSHARLTYDQVNEHLTHAESTLAPALVADIDRLHALYQALAKARYARGALDFDTTEGRVELDAEGQPIGVTVVQRHDAHRLIEECMLLANQAVAAFFVAREVNALFRVHTPPDADAMANLGAYLRLCGVSLPKTKTFDASQLTEICRKVQGRADEAVIQTMILRAMNQAVYTPGNAGHFGLHYDAYVQFTSPIRRYPDLVAHRALRAVLAADDPAGHSYPFTQLAELGDMTSQSERQAEEASRLATQKLKCALMYDKLGETYEGVVSGVVSFGLFVTLTDFLIDGLVPVATLHDDFYEFDRVKHQLIGQRTGRCYRQGDAVSVKVARADIAEGQIDLDIFSANDDSVPLKHLRRKPKWRRTKRKRND